MSSIKLHKMIHLKCLKHFLKNVQSNIYFYNVKELIECCTTFEFEFASKKKKISGIFHNAIQKERENKGALKRSTVNIGKSIKDILEKIVI